MRRIVLTGVLGLLALPAIAFAATHHYAGAAKNSECDSSAGIKCSVKLDATISNGHAKAVKGFTVKLLPIDCDQGMLVILKSRAPKMAVHADRGFHGTLHMSGGPRIKVTGRFAKNLKSVRGTFRQTADVSETETNCDTGTDSYSAKVR